MLSLPMIAWPGLSARRALAGGTKAFMIASSDTASKSRRRRRMQSSHVAPRGQRERVARPVVRHVEPLPVVRAPARRRRAARREAAARNGVSGAVAMTQRRSGHLEAILSARTLSAVTVASLLVVLLMFIQSDAFYVHHIEVGGLVNLTAEEVFALSGVANLHLFWVDPAEVRAQVLRSPSVADAEVRVGWPPHLIQIEIQEREPALIWEQAGVRTWIDVRGRVMQQRVDRTDLLRIVVEGSDAPIGPNVVIPQDVVDAALQLRELLPDLEVLIYDAVEGLGFQDPQGWRAWLGTGTDMAAKLNVYNAIVADLNARGIYPEFIDVGDVDAPYYRIWWREDETGTGQ